MIFTKKTLDTVADGVSKYSPSSNEIIGAIHSSKKGIVEADRKTKSFSTMFMMWVIFNFIAFLISEDGSVFIFTEVNLSSFALGSAVFVLLMWLDSITFKILGD